MRKMQILYREKDGLTQTNSIPYLLQKPDAADSIKSVFEDIGWKCYITKDPMNEYKAKKVNKMIKNAAENGCDMKKFFSRLNGEEDFLTETKR